MPFASAITKVTFADTAFIDGFGRLRVSDPKNEFETQHEYNLAPWEWESIASGGASAPTHLPNESSVAMTLGTTSGEKLIRQTYRFFRYQPGNCKLILMSAVVGAAKANVKQEMGYGDIYTNRNGIFLRQTSSQISLVRKSYATGSAVETEVAKAAWNLDRFDGTGPSRKTLDLSKIQIFFIDLEWLGAGRVRCGFIMDGKMYPAHEFNAANLLTSVYMTTANLPLFYLIENTGTAGSGTTMKQICSTVKTEGGTTNGDISGYPGTFGNNTTTRSADGTGIPVASIRPATTFNSITNRATIKHVTAECYAATNPALITFYYVQDSATALTGESFAAVDSNNSTMQGDVSATSIAAVSATVTKIGSLYVPSGGVSVGPGAKAFDLESKYPLAINAAATLQPAIVAFAQGIGGTASVGVNFSWKEVY